jgi:hypothetical protein
METHVMPTWFGKWEIRDRDHSKLYWFLYQIWYYTVGVIGKGLFGWWKD